jgi:hypothetical protein
MEYIGNVLKDSKVKAVASGAIANGKPVIVNSNGTVSVVSGSNLTSENFIGFADNAYADGADAFINSTCAIDRNQSSLTAGQKYFVQTDGTLSETADDPSVEAGIAISATEILIKG